MHYLVIIAIIAIIVIVQVWFFVNTIRKINHFECIFPQKNDKYQLLRTKGRSTIFANHNNLSFTTIVDSINDYLHNNKSVSDFHLMKDIVDRNCDAKEDEISTQIPVPLYMGLVGTMAGILAGVGFLVFSDGLKNLLDSGAGDAAKGVETLLGGVAIAMISSILGIILTTVGSNRFKTAKSFVESNKHTFLSWIQSRLLPTLSDNVVGAIREMAENLTKFNEIFSENIGNLGEALGKVNESYRLQTQLLDSVKEIIDKDITSQNLQLYNALKNSTKEIGTLAEYLYNTNAYLANVRALNNKLDKNETRTRTIEQMGEFFQAEVRQIEARKSYISQAVGKTDDALQKAFDDLRENAEKQMKEFSLAAGKQQEVFQIAFGKLHENAEKEMEAFYEATDKQQKMLLQKLSETETLVEELRNLTSVKTSISNLEQAARMQNIKFDYLAQSIEKLAQMKVNGPVKISLPKWVKIAALVVGGSIGTVCVGVIVFVLLFLFRVIH